MFAIVGTVPENDFPLIMGKVILKNGDIFVGEKGVPINRGTPALLAAAAKVTENLEETAPFAYLVGDTGKGDGSKKLYQYLVSHLGETSFSTLAFHYVQPLVEWHNRMLTIIEKAVPRPVLIADAGAMYMAKMSGKSDAYDLFTPDVGELAFLADETAPHPFYTRGFILHEENKVPNLITRAYTHGNASKYLLVKGSRDYVANKDGVQATIDKPAEKSMEAIGGTGDTLTGIVTALIASGMDIREAAIVAARVNRLAGFYAQPTPATQVMEIIQFIPEALKVCMGERK